MRRGHNGSNANYTREPYFRLRLTHTRPPNIDEKYPGRGNGMKEMLVCGFQFSGLMQVTPIKKKYERKG